MPAMVSDVVAESATAQVPPELPRVIVTTSLTVEADAEQCEYPVPRTIVGDAGSLKLVLKPTVIVLPAASAPVEEVWKPTVHVEVALATVEAGAKVTEVTEVGVMVIPDVGLTAVTSCEVATLKVVLA